MVILKNQRQWVAGTLWWKVNISRLFQVILAVDWRLYKQTPLDAAAYMKMNNVKILKIQTPEKLL